MYLRLRNENISTVEKRIFNRMHRWTKRENYKIKRRDPPIHNMLTVREIDSIQLTLCCMQIEEEMETKGGSRGESGELYGRLESGVVEGGGVRIKRLRGSNN